ncbi:MAG TPA: hypothetical protein VK656_03840, partial [Candidatus Acidoferrum sp.]|nr:hypothetical protein [Candidatus Acidoferrum sp.]
TGVESTIESLAVAVERALGRPVRVEHDEARVGDVIRNVSRVDKAAVVLGYRAAVGLDEGLALTARWFEPALRDPVFSGSTPNAASGSE